jgi:hypothetical protein
MAHVGRRGDKMPSNGAANSNVQLAISVAEKIMGLIFDIFELNP